MGSPATEFVQASRELSPVHAYVADHGEAVNSGEIICETIAGCSVAVSDDLTSDEQELVADAIGATESRAKACFANALRMWAYDSRFKYAEGFAVASDISGAGIEYAWCLLDRKKLVDVTRPSDHCNGAVIRDDEILKHYYDIGEERDIYGILGNHHDRFEFLRDRGYVDGD